MRDFASICELKNNSVQMFEKNEDVSITHTFSSFLKKVI